jgi:hypothetical protein
MRLDDENIGDIKPFGVRMPKELKAKIKESAKQNRHSMNAEIVGRLEASYVVGGGFEGLTPEQVQAVNLIISQFKQVNPARSLTYPM